MIEPTVAVMKFPYHRLKIFHLELPVNGGIKFRNDLNNFGLLPRKVDIHFCQSLIESYLSD